MKRHALWMASSGTPPATSLQAELATLGWALDPVAWGAWHGPVAGLALVQDEAQQIEALHNAPPWVAVLHGVPPAPVLAALLQRCEAALALAEASHRDALSGLLGRAALSGRMPPWLQERAGLGVQALLLLDLDRFKAVNERFGHPVGDLVIQQVGAMLADNATERDLAFRLGGEQFALLLSRTDDAVMRQEAEALLEAVRTMRVPGHDALRVTTSAGLAWLRAEDDVDSAMRRADAALHRAKATGRDRLAFDDNVRPERIDAEAELRRFMDVTQVYSERLAQMVHTLGRRLMQGARRDALEDRLTGVANRRYFDERLGRECRQGRALALLFLDLDDFGAINRRHGWNFGDDVLQRFVQRVAAGIRLTDWLARWGGEEFCVVMPETTLAEAAEVAERLRLAVAGATQETPDGQRLRLTCSIGVAALDPARSEDPDALAARAAAAVRRAKSAGKNRIEIDRC